MSKQTDIPQVMKKIKPIEKLLSNHTVSAEEFLSTPNISSSIRSQLPRFVNYCKTHKPFSERMLQLAFNVSYEELQDQKLKKASHTATEVLGNQEPQIAQMFFEPPPKVEETEQSEIKQEINDGGITSEAERLFKFSDDEEDTVPAEEKRDVQITREEFVSLSLQILKNKQKNDTCLGHLQKIYSFFIRHEPIPVLSYFESHPETLELWLKNIQYSSISTLLAQLLTSQDKNKQYKHESLKKAILQKVIEQIFRNIKDEFFFDGALVFLDEVLSATKQSYFEYFQDFKRISSILVTSQLMQRFYNELIDIDEDKLYNVSRYLETLFSRINSDNQDNRYYHKQENEPAVSFQIDVFVQNISTLLNLSTKIMSFKSITKIHYFSFLEGLINSQQVKAITVPINDPSFKALLDAYKGSNSGGIVKNKIYQVIKELISRTPEEKLRELTEKEPEVYETYFTTLKQANYANTKNYNKNQQSAFDVSLIAQLTRKQEQELAAASKAMGKDMKRICRKYDTKIASFQSTASFSLEEQCNFYQYSGHGSQSNGNQGGFGFNLSIGRNNVSIPVLQLPDRYHNSQKEEKQPLPQMTNSPNSPSNSPTVIHSSPTIKRDESSSGDPVIEEEEVVVLTDKLHENKVINLAQIMSNQHKEGMKDRQPEIPPESKGQKEEHPLKDVKDKEKLMDVPRLELTSKLMKEGKLGDDQAKARFFTRHLALYA